MNDNRNDNVFSIVVNAGALLRAFEAALDHASDDDSRALSHVLVECSEAGAHVVGTDGHRLVRYSIPRVSGSAPSFARLISGASARALVQVLKQGMRGVAKREREQAIATLYGSADDDLSVEAFASLLRLAVVQQQYPDYAQVIPREPCSEIAPSRGLNPTYLSDACRVAARMPGIVGVEVRVYGALDPVVMRAERGGEQCMILIMPVRI